ncbi:50S ribosomal protein L1 [Patescibacteria group bacterium]|nr:50S ribosomal protein L1 [Patescibacteria group bacterium]MBU1034940.1 50S ribosomal protein L1 [Patescibacteria group bacterium]MBU1630155.1 50S ribosomal protein L1 [Patescibacteria group bacterium]MBU1907746.1 50S ribosomal protein L1 [Patescibacteria group bacterium]
MPRSKRYSELKKLIDPKKVHSAAEAIELVKKTSTTKFNGSVETHFNLGIDPKKGDQQVRVTLILPQSIGKSVKIAAFVPADKEKEATDAGAEIVGGEEMVAQIASSGKIDFDIAVATPDMMPKMAKVAKILGPKGLMPNPKTDTVSANVKKMIEELKRGKVTLKNDATGNLHQVIGKTSLEADKLEENFKAVIDAVRKAKPASSKGVYIKKAVLTSTMGPAVPIDVTKI